MGSRGTMWLVLVAVIFSCGAISIDSTDDACMDSATLKLKINAAISQAVSTLKGDVTLPARRVRTVCDYHKHMLAPLSCMVLFFYLPMQMEYSGGTLKNVNGLRGDGGYVDCGSALHNNPNEHWTSKTHAFLTEDEPYWTLTFKNFKASYFFIFTVEGELTYNIRPSIMAEIYQKKDLCSTEVFSTLYDEGFTFTPTTVMGKLLAPIFHYYLGSGYVDSTGSGSSDVLDYSEQYLPQLEENPDYSQTIRFHLWTRSNASNSHLIHIGDSSSVSDSAFNSSKLTHVLIHGFRGNVEHPIIQLVKDAILRHCDSNVIGVDWGDIAVKESYADVVPHVKSVGNHVCQLLLYLKKQADLSGKKLHVIGHSLGAHVSGFAGKKCLEEAFRVVHITGLDPALPAFYTANSKQRLDSSDADFVDCIYGASGSYGYVTPICQANFYANGGSIQPYCLTTYERKKDEICSHEVVVQYYAESVDPRHVFDTRSCGNFNNSADCPRVLMGYYADPTAPGVFVPKTKVVYPFARKILQKSFNTCGGVHHN